MAKIVLTDQTNTYNATSINEQLTRIEAEFQDKVLYRNNPAGESNVMESSLDMNSKRVLNLPEPLTDNEAARLVDVRNATAGAAANLISFTPTGTIAGTNVQTALAEVDSEKMATSSLAASSGASLVGNAASGAGAVLRTQQDKNRDFVDARDYGAVIGGNVGAAVNLALAAGHTRIRISGTYSLSTQILLSTLNNIVIDASDSVITAAAGLNVTMIRLINCNRCTIYPGTLDGFASGQTASSFGIDLNGGSYNKVIGGRVTNCKTYGIYNIGCNYALVEGIEADNCQQSGIAGDVGGASVRGFRVKDVIVHDNGLGGVGALSGLYLEGQPASSLWFEDLVVSGVIAYGNRGAGVAGQGWQLYTLEKVNARGNYQQGIALAACLYGSGGNFSLNGNDVSALAGYDNGIALDDAAVTPASQYNTFTNIFSINHNGYAVMERGTANNNSFLGVDSVFDGAVFSLAGVNSLGLRRNEISGNLGFNKKMTGNSAASGVGYGAGAGGTVTQITSKSTGVTLNAPSGRITMEAGSLAAGALAEFVLTNSAIAASDIVICNVVSGATQAAYIVNARPATGQATIEVRNNTAGALAQALVISFAIIKGATS